MIIEDFPLVSVVLPTYNSGRFLKLAVESILNQSYRNLELIVVDDASEDNTWSNLVNYVTVDSRVRIFRNKKNLGIAKTRNVGLRQALGQYYAVMDHDDVSLPNRLSREVEFLNRNPEYAAVGCQVQIINSLGQVIKVRRYPTSATEIRKTLGIKSPICNPAALLRLSCVKEFDLYDERYPGCEDYDLWFKLANKYKLTNLDEFLFQYRLSDAQVKSKKAKRILLHTLQIKRGWIFKNNFFNAKTVLVYFLDFLLLLIPEKIILFLFQATTYEKK